MASYLHQLQSGPQQWCFKFLHLQLKYGSFSPDNLTVHSKEATTETRDADSTFTLQQQQCLRSLVLMNNS